VALGATALLFTGAGALSVDAKVFSRPRWPCFVTVAVFVVAIAAAVVAGILLAGTNPIHFSSPAGQNLLAGKNCHCSHNRDSKNS
jgi:putative oxidoreductase